MTGSETPRTRAGQSLLRGKRVHARVIRAIEDEAGAEGGDAVAVYRRGFADGEEWATRRAEGAASTVLSADVFEAMRIERGWPTPYHMRHAADALDMLVIPRYGDVLRWFADLCDGLPTPEPGPDPRPITEREAEVAAHAWRAGYDSAIALAESGTTEPSGSVSPDARQEGEEWDAVDEWTGGAFRDEAAQPEGSR